MSKIVEHDRVLSILNRIAYHGTADADLIQSVEGLRRVLNGKAISDVLTPPASQGRKPAAKYRSYTASQAEIEKLKERLKEVEAEKTISVKQKQKEIEALLAQIATMQTEMSKRAASTEEQREDGSFTYAQVLQAMVRKFGKHHGIPAALAERNARLLADGNEIGKITSPLFQQWRKMDRYPSYVVEQINAMTEDDLLPRGGWTPEEKEFLAAVYSANETLSNCQLARVCSAQFGRLVTECSIKGELNRLRKKGRVSMYRPRLSA